MALRPSQPGASRPNRGVRAALAARTRAGVCPLALMLASLVVGCGWGSGEGNAEEAPQPVTVETTQVRARLLRDVATFNGQLSAENSVMVKSEADGVVDEVLFEEGQDVEEGEVLVRLRSAEQRARLREAEANLALAQDVYDRTHKLATAAAASEAARSEAAAALSVARARVEVARVELERTEIRAPFDGVLGMRLVSPGDRITDETPLVQIDAVDRLQVSFAISERGILFTRVGAPVEVSVAPYPNETFPGEVFFVSPTLDPATRRIIAKAWVPNPHRRLRPGLFANVEMEIDRRDDAILVPESAIVLDREGTYVWKLDDQGVPARVPIETGLRKEGMVEVTLGLRDGDRIVVAGTHKVKEGEKVVAKSRAGDTSRAAGQARTLPAAGAGAGT